jgi:hypothetical protein
VEYCNPFNTHCQAQGHADDIVLLQKGRFVITFCNQIPGALNCVENCSTEIGLSVNADKTTIVLFTNNKKIGSFYNRRLFGTKLKLVDEEKDLVIILDKKHDCEVHLEKGIRKLHIGIV